MPRVRELRPLCIHNYIFCEVVFKGYFELASIEYEQSLTTSLRPLDGILTDTFTPGKIRLLNVDEGVFHTRLISRIGASVSDTV